MARAQGLNSGRKGLEPSAPASELSHKIHVGTFGGNSGISRKIGEIYGVVVLPSVYAQA